MHSSLKIVGNKRKIVGSDQSGKSNIISMLNTVGISPEEHKNKLDHLLQEVKNKEYQGHSFDEALASFEILDRKT